MLAVSALTECLLNLALQRNLAGFQEALKITFEQAGLSAWAVIFPAGSAIGSRPIFMAHGIASSKGAALAQDMEARKLSTLAKEFAPAPTCHYRVLRIKRDRDGEFFLFCYRPAAANDFVTDELATLDRIGRLLDRCFLLLTQAQELEFEAGLFRLVGNLHPEGLCILDSRLRVLFENRRFRELIQVWTGGLSSLQSLSLPKQSELPAEWRRFSEQSFQAFQEVKFPPVSGRMVVSQGPSSTLRKTISSDGWIEGAVRYLAFQSTMGVRPYLILTCSFHREQSGSHGLDLKRVAEKLGFSRRETELAGLILQGSSAREIADRLKIALPTVKTHIRHILHKSGVKTRLQFVGLCNPRD